MSSDRRQALGVWGERVAEGYLLARGARLIARRFRCRGGELDLVLDLHGELLFVEVKARRALGYGTPAAAVTPTKQRRMARAAQLFLARHGWLERRCRFDIVEVIGRGQNPEIRHIPDAFRI